MYSSPDIIDEKCEYTARMGQERNAQKDVLGQRRKQTT
jgi:hypothetical protein